MALTYFEPFIDTTGCLRAYGMVNLRVLGRYDWRLSAGHVWKVERLLYEIPHTSIRYSTSRVDRLRRRYFTFRREHPGVRPVAYYDRSTWSELPAHFLYHIHGGTANGIHGKRREQEGQHAS